MKKIIFTLLAFLFLSGNSAFAQNRWSGVDETVVERIAQEHGRAAWVPFINTDQGDLLLFVFLLAGVASGFVLGFCWRKLFVEKEDVKRNI